MAKNDQKTTKKTNAPKLFNGKEDGKHFSSEYQPSPEQKKEGWEKWRAKRMLTQTIIQMMTKENTLEDYTQSLMKLAKEGNAKAIETINKCVEDDISKSEITHTIEKGAKGIFIED